MTKLASNMPTFESASEILQIMVNRGRFLNLFDAWKEFLRRMLIRNGRDLRDPNPMERLIWLDTQLEAGGLDDPASELRKFERREDLINAAMSLFSVLFVAEKPVAAIV